MNNEDAGRVIAEIQNLLTDIANSVEQGTPQIADIDIDQLFHEVMEKVIHKYVPANKHLQQALIARFALHTTISALNSIVPVQDNQTPLCSKCGGPVYSGARINGTLVCTLCYRDPEPVNVTDMIIDFLKGKTRDQ